MPAFDYMDSQQDIDWTMRQALIDWLCQVHLRYHLLPETLWIAINIIDRFLSRRVVSQVKLQLVGVCAMFIAAKYEEILAPSIRRERVHLDRASVHVHVRDAVALRLKAGDSVTLFNGDGRQYRARLVAADPRAASVHVEAMETPVRESPVRITLLQSLARGEKMDWNIQKACELGAVRILPITSERSEVRMEGPRSGKRLDHWRAIAIAACEQCGRNVVPGFSLVKHSAVSQSS